MEPTLVTGLRTDEKGTEAEGVLIETVGDDLSLTLNDGVVVTLSRTEVHAASAPDGERTAA